MNKTFKEKCADIQQGIEDVKKRIANFEAKRSGRPLPFQEVELREDSTEARLEEVQRIDAQNQLAKFREAVILDALVSQALSGGPSEREISFEVDRLLTPMKGEEAQRFLEDVAMAPLLGKDIHKGKMLQWLQEYRPFPRRD